MNTNSTLHKNVKLVTIARVVMIIFSLIVAYPIFFVIITSLKTNQEFYSNIWFLPKDFQWRNYVQAWVVGKIGTYFINSIVVSVASVFFTCIVALIGGYALAKLYIPKSESIMMFFMTFTFLPGIAIYIPLYIQMSKMHLLNSYLTLIIPYTAWQIPFSMYIFKKFFETIPIELIESARVDGCKEHQTFYKIVLPLVTPAIATVTVFNFISVWGELMWANITMAASVKYRTLPIGLLNFKGEMGVQWGQFAAGISIVIIPLVVVFIYTQKYFIQGLTAGAVKG
jgi:ABC-type glycerol-3-phosphate transport system permease component